MASVSYSIKSKNDLVSIYVRFKVNNQYDVQRRFGDFLVNQKFWDSKKKKFSIKNKPELNEINLKMIEFEKLIIDEYSVFSINESNQNQFKLWFQNKLDIFFNKFDETKKVKFILFTNFIDYFVSNIENFKNEKNEIYSKSFISQFKNLLLKINEFQKEYYKVYIEEVNVKFRNDFVEFLYEYYDFEDSTVDKYIKNLKLICKHALSFGTKISKDFLKREFKRTRYETNEIYLTEEEINRISSLDLSINHELSQSRDCFIVYIWTGIRFSDYKNLSVRNISTDSFGNKYITLTTKKTNKKVTIPLHQNVLEIIAKYNNNFPSQSVNSIYNKNIKILSKLANINENTEGKVKKINEKGEFRSTKGLYKKWQLVKAHTTRRSFATNMFLKGIPTYNIMQITGHTTETNFFKYIRLTNFESATMIHQIWNQND